MSKKDEPTDKKKNSKDKNSKNEKGKGEKSKKSKKSLVKDKHNKTEERANELTKNINDKYSKQSKNARNSIIEAIDIGKDGNEIKPLIKELSYDWEPYAEENFDIPIRRLQKYMQLANEMGFEPDMVSRLATLGQARLFIPEFCTQLASNDHHGHFFIKL